MKKYKILIVEDEQIPANYIKKVLEQHGHDVLGIVDSKQEALNFIEQKIYPELILMDIKIKGDEDGIDTAKAFLEHTKVAIVYLSAYSNDSYLQRAKETHPIGFLVKPVQSQTLLSTIEIGMDNFIQDNLSQKIAFSSSSSFDPQEQIIINNGIKILLSKYESILLSTLLKHKNRLISYTILENSAWIDEPPKYGALRTTIWRLRKKLPDSVEIKNLYSSGYKIDF